MYEFIQNGQIILTFDQYDRESDTESETKSESDTESETKSESDTESENNEFYVSLE